MRICPPFRGCKPKDITQGFSSAHQAIDFAAPYGTFLVAPEDCRISAVRTAEVVNDKTEELARGYGVFMEAENRRYGYWHCLPMFPVEVGQFVKQGEIVGQMGNSGFVLSGGKYVPIEIRTKAPYHGTHVHYSMAIDNKSVNPLDFIDYSIPINYDVLTAIKAIAQRMLNLLKNK